MENTKSDTISLRKTHLPSTFNKEKMLKSPSDVL